MTKPDSSPRPVNGLPEAIVSIGADAIQAELERQRIALDEDSPPIMLMDVAASVLAAIDLDTLTETAARQAKALRMALPVLIEERRSLIEQHSRLRLHPSGQGVEPVPGTLDPDVAKHFVHPLDTVIGVVEDALAASIERTNHHLAAEAGGGE